MKLQFNSWTSYERDNEVQVIIFLGDFKFVLILSLGQSELVRTIAAALMAQKVSLVLSRIPGGT